MLFLGRPVLDDRRVQRDGCHLHAIAFDAGKGEEIGLRINRVRLGPDQSHWPAAAVARLGFHRLHGNLPVLESVFCLVHVPKLAPPR